MNKIESALILNNDSGISYSYIKFPLLNYLSIELCTLVAIILSYDIFVRRVNNISANKLNKLLKNYN